MVTEAARVAGEQDLATLEQLARAAADELAGQKGGALWEQRENRRYLPAVAFADALRDEDELVAVGTLDDVVVGYGTVRTEHLRDGSLLAVVDDIFVLPGARGVGVGEVVMDLLLVWARERGCIGIDALALPGMRETKNFFERFGLTARAIVVHRSFTGAGEGS